MINVVTSICRILFFLDEYDGQLFDNISKKLNMHVILKGKNNVKHFEL